MLAALQVHLSQDEPYAAVAITLASSWDTYGESLRILWLLACSSDSPPIYSVCFLSICWIIRTAELPAGENCNIKSPKHAQRNCHLYSLLMWGKLPESKIRRAERLTCSLNISETSSNSPIKEQALHCQNDKSDATILTSGRAPERAVKHLLDLAVSISCYRESLVRSLL